MIEPLLHKFYAANISIDAEGGMLVASTQERMLAWLILFGFLALLSLIAWFVWRGKYRGRVAMGFFIITLGVSILTIPSVKNEYIHVSPHTLTIGSGSWYRPSTTILQMTNIRNIRETDEDRIMPGNLIGDPDVDWHITWEDGKARVFRLNDFFNAHRMVVAYYYKDRGYWLERLEDQTRTPL